MNFFNIFRLEAMDVDIHIIKLHNVEDNPESVLQDGGRIFENTLTHEGQVQGHAMGSRDEAAQGC